jgi:hypothetical protein
MLVGARVVRSIVYVASGVTVVSRRQVAVVVSGVCVVEEHNNVRSLSALHGGTESAQDPPDE